MPRSPMPRKEPTRSADVSRLSAMRALAQRCESLLVTVRALDQLSARARKHIDNQPYYVGKKNQQHPHDRSVHASSLRIFEYPDKQRDAEREESEDDEQVSTRARR